MGNPLTRCAICGDDHTGTANACADCAQHERATDAWLVRERAADRAEAAVALRGHLAVFRHYEQGGR